MYAKSHSHPHFWRLHPNLALKLRMHPSSITYQGVSYPLNHLVQRIRILPWRSRSGHDLLFSVRLRYSNHCYSRELKDNDVQEQDDTVVEMGPPVRVFCPQRYGQTSLLTQMIEGLFAKPTSRVSLTSEANWTVFYLYTPAQHPGADRYCVFFRLRRSHIVRPNGQLPVDMYVESGYPRMSPVKVLRHSPFGRALEEAVP